MYIIRGVISVLFLVFSFILPRYLSVSVYLDLFHPFYWLLSILLYGCTITMFLFHTCVYYLKIFTIESNIEYIFLIHLCLLV